MRAQLSDVYVSGSEVIQCATERLTDAPQPSDRREVVERPRVEGIERRACGHRLGSEGGRHGLPAPRELNGGET